MDLVWDDSSPVSETSFFTRDVYDKYSLAPAISELWALTQSPPTVTVEVKEESQTAEPEGPASQEQHSQEVTVPYKGHVEDEPSACWESCDSDSSSGCDDNKKKQQKKNKKKIQDVKREPHDVDTFPEPRLPYPCMSILSYNDQKTYLGILTKKGKAPQGLKMRVKQEEAQFTMYLQDVARMCADDYKSISQGALRYSEEFLSGCLEYLRNFPQFSQIHEMTSLTGGTYNPRLALTFEKQLLALGKVDITSHNVVPADAQLASDYESVSSENPPSQKAKDKHASISSDRNAENLCAHYEPHVCLTRDALVRLLDNFGDEFSDPWELPVSVKLNPGKAGRKTVYIDSPLMRTDTTVRERSHFFHEESLKLSINKAGQTHAYNVRTEVTDAGNKHAPESTQRSMVSFEETGLDFEADLTDLETFGEATVKPAKRPKGGGDEHTAALSPPTSPQTRKTTRSSMRLAAKNTTICPQAEVSSSSSLSHVGDRPNGTSPQGCVETSASQISEPKVTQARREASARNSQEESDDEKLIIDDPLLSPPSTRPTEPETTSPDPVERVPADLQSPGSPQNIPNVRKRVCKRAKAVAVPGDQLGQLLCMQTAMLKAANKDPTKPAASAALSEVCSPPPTTGAPSSHTHPTSLVKACVSSYLESAQSQDGETCYVSTAHGGPAASVDLTAAEHKKILSQDLQASAEDVQDYEAPEQGNLLYKLYSLQDVLLMVRSSLSFTHTRRVEDGSNSYVPVHVLPKLEYQMCYGVECVTHSECCQQWVETLLHSSTVRYIAHINAHTSEVVLLRKLPEKQIDYKHSKQLNILHHLLKKMISLEEGRYLIRHKAGDPFVTILKAASGKQSQYTDLRTVPPPPACGPVPWVAVDPAVVLPFHQKHGRVPCTFPPRPDQMSQKGRPTVTNKQRGQPPPQGNAKAGSKKKKNRKKKGGRAARRNEWMKKTIQRSVENPNM